MSNKTLILTLAALLILGALAVTPAAAGRPAVAPAQTAVSTPPPAGTPDPAPGGVPAASAGGLIFAQHCAACHGLAGHGDGSQAAQVTQQTGSPLPDLGSADYARTKSLADWYTAITDGRVDKLMPPFKDSLNDAERQAVLFYVLTLTTPADSIDAGRQAYAANCARCHGTTGAGDGLDAKQPLPDFTKFNTLFALSQKDLFDAIVQKHPDVPANATLTDAQRWALADAVRAFGYTYAEPAALAKIEISVTGVVTNATNGGQPVDGVPFTLYAFDSAILHSQTTSPVPSVTLSGTVTGGAFAFPAMKVPAEGLLWATLTYQDVRYSAFEVIAPDVVTATLPITVFDAISDPSAVQVNQLHVLLEPQGTVMNVTEILALSAQGNHAFNGTLSFDLPAGATNVTFPPSENSGEFIATQYGFAGQLPVKPGDNAQVVVDFRLPYDNGLQFSQKMAYAAQSVSVAVPDGTALQGSGLQKVDMGEQTPQGTQGQPLAIYTVSAVQAGGTLELSIAGKPFDWTTVLAGAGALLLVLGAFGIWYRQRRQSAAGLPDDEDEDEDQDEGEALPEPGEEPDREALLQAIADLDDAFDDGRVDEARYRRERAALKAQLARKS
jgi:mono/diheme cytochrome c family protein